MNFGIGHETCRKLIGFVFFSLSAAAETLLNKYEAILASFSQKSSFTKQSELDFEYMYTEMSKFVPKTTRLWWFYIHIKKTMQVCQKRKTYQHFIDVLRVMLVKERSKNVCNMVQYVICRMMATSFSR